MRRRVWLWVLGIVLVCLALMAGAFAAGYFLHSSSEEAVANADRPQEAYVAVEEGGITPQPIQLEGKAQLGDLFDIYYHSKDGQGTVTKTRVETGGTITSGTLLAHVNGRPVFALALPFDLYRDITPGAQGDDVAALQTALKSIGYYKDKIDGVYNAATSAAITKLYGAHKQQAPLNDEENKQAIAPVSEIVRIPSTGTIDTLASVNTKLNDTTPLFKLRTGQARALGRVLIGDEAAFQPGTALTITHNGVETKGNVTSISELRETDQEHSEPGYDVTVSLASLEGLTDGANVTISTERGSETKGMKIPLTALRQENSHTYVLRGKQHERVEVAVLITGDGSAIVESASLKAGDSVLLGRK